ncbi:three-helix bundle dimerization domain-containing protein [Nocardia vermiculata]|uniref:three-helix bundle dimerization domain-containing protein n=1 Tax=Nocardia vermiculata TaxID=257274 RepID=UPI000AE35D88|nr:hypothetical protein [Nocardia vermiculata]
MDEATDREEKALRQLTSRLVDHYDGNHSADHVHDVVGRVRRRFDGHTVRDFVPILVERIAHRELREPPPSRRQPEAEVPAAQDVPPEAAEASETKQHSEDSGDAPSDVAEEPSAAVAVGAGSSVETTPATTAQTGSIPPRPGAAKRTLVATLRRHHIAATAGAAAIVVVLLVAVIAVAGFRNNNDAAPSPAAAVVTARGVVGSEKLSFFRDPAVVEALARNGIRLEVEPAGSRQIATTVDLSGADFAFPSSSLAAERIQRERAITTKYTPFSSPMVIATFRPIAEALTRAGIVRPGPVPAFDMRRYLALAQQGVQWDRLPGNTAYPVRKNVLISTTDPRTSNSAAMYLAVAAYVANDDAIVRGSTAEQFVLSKVSRLFTGQGYTDNSSAGPFAEYLAGGMGPTPMVWGYESQFVEAAIAGKLPADAVLAYPSPTVLSRHTLIPFSPTGDRIGRLLSTDPVLQRLAAEHGFRTADPSAFAGVVADHRVPVARDLVDVVDTPTYDTLEHLLDGVARAYN